MGSDPVKDNFAQPDELPQHRVYVSEFFISKFEITHAQYAVYAQANNLPFEVHSAQANFPAVYVRWPEAMAFCEWLSQAIGKPVRLPTEAEWDKAARSTDGRLYPWGDQWDPTALNTSGDGASDAMPVDAHSPAGDSPYGAADMVGNVWEWTADWYAPDTYAERVMPFVKISDPTGPATGSHRVMRGGSHFFRQSGTRAARRFKYNPNYRCYDIGFRVVVAEAKHE